ncbi:MAG: hypothetical protein EXS16_18755 [Gemmataceae bacterium]|nr:hypothetical protein [Gemmataceae bacterium]
MNSRERMLLIVFLSIVGNFLVFIGLWQFMWIPYESLKKDNVSLEETNLKLAKVKGDFAKDQKRMALARLKSLPFDRNFAITEYDARFLGPLLKSAGLKVDDITPSATLADVSLPKQFTGIKTVGHKTMTFTVNARGGLDQIVDALEMLKVAPYEHRIKSVSVDRVSTSTANDASKQLKMTMVLETLLVARASTKPGVAPGVDPRNVLIDALLARVAPFGGFGSLASETFILTCVPRLENRDYETIAKRNIFVGMVPPPPKEVIVWKDPPPDNNKVETIVVDPGPKEPDTNILAFVRLSMAVPSDQTAYLMNRYENKEIKLIARPNSGYDTFVVGDPDSEFVYFKAKVLRVDGRKVFFQIKERVYEIHMTQTLDDALAYPLTIERLDDLDLERDREWEKSQVPTKIDDPRSKGGTKTNSKTPTKSR